MIFIKPHLGQVFPTGIFGDLLRRQMGMIVNYWLAFGVAMVELHRLFGL